MRDTHDILKYNLLLLCGVLLNLFCRRKINQIFLHNHFRQFITGIRNHAISSDTALFCDTDIRCTSSHINQSDIQHSKILWNRNINCRNWLQCQIGNLQASLLNSRIKSVYNIFRKESNDNIFFNKIRLMAFQTCKEVAIQIIMHHRIAHAEEFVFLILLVFLFQFLLCLVYTEKIQRM